MFRRARTGSSAPPARATLPRALGLRSITVKNLCLFVPIFLIALLPLVLAYWNDSRQNRIATLAARMEVVAEQSARRIDPKLVRALATPATTGTAPHTALVAVLAGIQREFDVDNAVLMRRHADGHFEYLADGNAQFEVGQRAGLHDRFPETRRAALQAWERRGALHTELFGFGTFEYLQFNKAIEQDGKVVALLMLNKFAEDVDQAIKGDTLRLVSLTLGILLFGGVVFWVFSSRLLRPLLELELAANRLASGERGVEIAPVRGHDEVARLNGSFRQMVTELAQSHEALERSNTELRRTLARVQLMEDLEKNLFKFVPRSVRSALSNDPGAMERGKLEKDVTVLFLDVEGSSKLTESLAPGQAEELIESYFSRFLDDIYENQGDITETAGDGLMLIFQNDEPAQHALNAVRTALAIQAKTDGICLLDDAPESCLRINIGINSGRARVGFSKYESVSGARVTFTASGRTTIVAARLQDKAAGGTVLISQGTLERIRTHPAFAALAMRLHDVGDVPLKNLHEPEHVYRVTAQPAN